MESAEARFSGGASSAARGMRICGVTEKVPIKNERTSKTMRLLVSARPMERLAVRKVRMRTSGRLLTRSPNGEMKSRPTA